MTETLPIEPDKNELPKRDRSAEGVSKAIGRIAERLSARIQKVGNRENNLDYWEESTDAGIVRRKTLLFDHDSGATARTDHIQIESRVHDGVDISHKIMLSRSGTEGGQVIVDTKDSRPVARLSKANPDVPRSTFGSEELSVSKITGPRMVGEVAANILEKARGRVADAELEAKKVEMVDFVNGKQK